MNLPHLPSKFSSGETLTAAKLNALVDWMRDVARLLPGLQVNTGRGLIYSRSSAGTTVSLAHGYLQGSDSGEDAAAVPAARPRRLFAWSTETGGDAERPTWIDGLALVRPNQASAPEPCVAGVILGAGAGTVNVVLNDVPALNKVTLTTDLISFPEKRVSAAVSVPVPSASTTTIALQATGTASSTEVSVTIPQDEDFALCKKFTNR